MLAPQAKGSSSPLAGILAVAERPAVVELKGVAVEGSHTVAEIEPLGIPIDQPSGDGSDIRSGGCGGIGQRRKPLRLRPRIVVEQNQRLAFGERREVVVALGKAEIRRTLDQPDPGVMLSHPAGRAVPRAVVEQQQLPGATRIPLRAQRRQADFEMLPAVPAEDENRELALFRGHRSVRTRPAATQQALDPAVQSPGAGPLHFANLPVQAFDLGIGSAQALRELRYAPSDLCDQRGEIASPEVASLEAPVALRQLHVRREGVGAKLPQTDSGPEIGMALLLRGVDRHRPFERRETVADVDETIRVPGMVDLVKPDLEVARDLSRIGAPVCRAEHVMKRGKSGAMIVGDLERRRHQDEARVATARRRRRIASDASARASVSAPSRISSTSIPAQPKVSLAACASRRRRDA